MNEAINIDECKTLKEITLLLGKHTHDNSAAKQYLNDLRSQLERMGKFQKEKIFLSELWKRTT